MLQREVADLTGVTQQTIRNIETFNRLPSCMLAFELSQISDVSMEQIVQDYLNHHSGDLK